MTTPTRIDLNRLARTITLDEGGKESLSVAQVKEVIRLVLDKLAEYPASQVLALLEARRDD